MDRSNINRMRLRIIGTGSSVGVPMIGCHCKACTSTSKFNKRLRTSALLEWDDKVYLIDASPDIRQMAFKFGIDRIDAVLLTHYHADHTVGLNELRPYYFHNGGTPIPLILSESTLDSVQTTYDYLIDRFEPIILKEEAGAVSINQHKMQYFSFSQESVHVTGYRFGDIAYITDIKEFDDSIFQHLKGVKVLILSALNRKGSKMHFSIEDGISFGKMVGAMKVYFTHIAHELEHEETNSELPPGFELAYDGLEIDV